MLWVGSAVIKSHICTHEERVIEAIAMVFNKERIGPEYSGCLQSEKKGLVSCFVLA